MSVTITGIKVRDIRFPTSRELHGSDAMNPDPDYSAAYVELQTNDASLTGCGLTFTIGRGTELCVAAIESLAHTVVDRSLDEITANMGAFYREVTGESQLRWVGPEKGVIHLAAAALMNAVWDLFAKQAGKPLWRLISDMTPEEIVACIDFRYITDLLTPDEALELLRAQYDSRQQRIQEMESSGYPSYTTSAGWLGYSDEKLRSQLSDLSGRGWTHFKIKVGRDLDDDLRRCRILREEIGPDARLMMDANQVWDVDDAIQHMQQLAQFDPWFIEEPTCPDDIFGHAAIAKAIHPILVATGEMCHNRVMFKQLMQAGGLQVCQIDSCRLGSLSEILAVQLMAHKLGIPVCPHAGGVGLCEYVQHLIMIDYICISGSLDDRVAEYSDHLHEHFVHPLNMQNGHYMPPTAPGYSAEMRPETLAQYEFPTGPEWANSAK